MALLLLLWRVCLKLRRKDSIPAGLDVVHADQFTPTLGAKQRNEQPGFQGDGLPYGVAICIGTLASMALSK